MCDCEDVMCYSHKEILVFLAGGPELGDISSLSPSSIFTALFADGVAIVRIDLGIRT